MRAQALAVRFQAAPKTMPSRGYFDDGRAQVQIEINRVLGGLYLDKGRTQEAQAAYRRNVALARKCAEDYPSNRLYRGISAQHYLILANSLTDPADREEAEQAWQQAYPDPGKTRQRIHPGTELPLESRARLPQLRRLAPGGRTG